MQDKNLILAVALSLLVYMGWTFYMERAMPKPARQPQIVDSTPPIPESAAPAAPSLEKTSGGGPSGQGAPASVFGIRPVGQKVEAAELGAGTLKLEFTTYGAALTSCRFADVTGPVELIVKPAPGLFATWPDTVFALKSQSPSLLVFEANTPEGFVATKTYRLNPEGTIHTLRLSVFNPSSQEKTLPSWNLNLGPGLGTVKSEQKENASMWRAVALLKQPSVKKPFKIKKLKLGDYSESWKWVGLDNRYFLAALLAKESEPMEKIQVVQGMVQEQKSPQIALVSKPSVLPAKSRKDWEFDFYLGPKDYVKLKGLGHDLHESVDFGFFGSLGKLALFCLQALYRVTGNYGLAIIVMTVALQFILFPLTYKSFKATLSMKKIQPQMKLIQEKYKEDPKRMNVEIMQLYKSGGANPLGGCLPMLLQIPVFFALFTTLRNSWELHGAFFMLWIRDLSAYDPYYILPVLMGGVMLLQQKLNPASADPDQAKMMMWMSGIFTFMFLHFPSGLVLYWMTNSILGICQQMLYSRYAS